MQPFGENTANIPAFLGKLWKMVNDPSIDHLICWSPMGNSFIIQNQAQFWYELLPLYYKHNNMSSFVRQLNMYGFHKMSIVENGTMDADKDEIQFYHKYFQKDQPELLKNIKRKVTTSKASENNLQNILRHDDITKVLTDVKQLKGKQSTVDSQLSTMKQENAVLWRELALLRQKHMKQQQIVNKLIQFLVTLVQPSANSRMGVGVKRRMPLMLHESPPKKVKTKKSNNHDNNDNGPTIHELDNEIEVSTDEFFDQDIQDQGMVTSPTTSTSPHSSEYNKPPSVSSNDGSDVLSDNFWDKPEFVEISHLHKDDVPPNNEYIENSATDVQSNDTVPQTSEKVFLNPTGGDALLSNFANGSYNTDVIDIRNGKNKNNSVVGQSSNNSLPNTNNMRVVAKDVKINNGTHCTNDCSRDDLDLHLESTQTEIEQLRDILHGCNSFDATTLLGDEGAVIPRNELAADLSCLFSDEAPDYGLTNHNGNIQNTNNNSSSNGSDPLVSGGQLVNSNNSLIDFNELFDDSIDGTDINELAEADISSTVNTPMVVKAEPMFPNLETDY